MSAQRQFPRYAIDAQVTIRDAGGEVIAAGRASNLSRSGLSAEIDADLPRGPTVRAAIALVFDAESSSEPLEVTARVVWSTGLGAVHQVGLAFLGLTPVQTTYLDMFIRFLEGADSDEDDDDDDPREPGGLPFDT